MHDELAEFVSDFDRPNGSVYLAGHSLGLSSQSSRAAITTVLQQWQTLGVKGWSDQQADWFHLVEATTEKLAGVIGCQPESLTVTGTTTSNLHQMLATFLPGTNDRSVLIDGTAFPTDRYAIASILKLLNGNEDRLRTVEPDANGLLHDDKIIHALSADVGIIVLPTVVYQTGQRLDVRRIVEAAHGQDIIVGLDCSHSAGVDDHDLDQIGADFAVFSTYKYLNGGPGSMAGLYINRRHADRLPALAGWFGCDKQRQFKLDPQFVPARNAGRFQIGTPHILSLAALNGALDVHAKAGIGRIRAKSLALTQCLMTLCDEKLTDYGVSIVTCRDDHRRGGHVTFQVEDAAQVSKALREANVIGDHRPPNFIRFGPSPLSTTFEDCERAIEVFANVLSSSDFRRIQCDDLVT